MKISFHRTGGFAGLEISIDVDIRSLENDPAQNLRDLVYDADFFHLPDPEIVQGYQDGFQYAIKVEKDNEERTIQFNDRSMPNKLRPLVDELTKVARSQRPSK